MTDPQHPPAARKVLAALESGEVLTGERIGTNDPLRFVMRKIVENEIVRTTYLTDSLIAGMIKSHALHAVEGRKVGLSLYFEYRAGKAGKRG